MRNDLELNLIMQEVLSNKKDVLEKINFLIETLDNEEEIKNLIKLKAEIEKIDLEEIIIDISADEFESYFISFEGSLYKGFLDDFYFEYDNNNHELYISSFSFKDDILII